MTTRGIDVSSYQGVVDWQAMHRKHSIDWAAVKATEGTGYTNPTFDENWAGLKAAGIVRVAYHYGRPGQDATAQARRLVGLAKPRPGDVLCLDLETADDRSQSQVNAWARAFAAESRRLAPEIALWLYVGSGYAANGTGAGLADHFDVWWMPRYPYAPGTSHTWTTWTSDTSPALPGGLTIGWKAPHVWQFTDALNTGQGAMDASVSSLPISTLTRPRTSTPTTPTPPVQEDFMATLSDAEKALMFDLLKRAAGAAEHVEAAGLPALARVDTRTAAAGDPARLAAAVAARLPQGQIVTGPQLEDALRNVLGSVDNTPGA